MKSENYGALAPMKSIGLSAVTPFALAQRFICVVMLSTLIVLSSGCATSTRVDENRPIPGGRILKGEVLGGDNMVFRNSSNQEVAGPHMLSVSVGGARVQALYAGEEVPRAGQWVEVAEGVNGRWFVIGFASAPSRPAQPQGSRPTTTVRRAETNAEKLAVELDQALASYRIIYAWRKSPDRATRLKTQLAKLRQSMRRAKRYRIEPPQELVGSINYCLDDLEAKAVAILAADGSYEDEYAEDRYYSPERLNTYDRIEKWRDLILEGGLFRVVRE